MTLTDVNSFDLTLFHLINGGYLPQLDGFFVFLSKRHLHIFAVAVALVFIQAAKRREALWFLTAVLIAFFASDYLGANVLKPLIGRVRPCYLLPPENVRQLLRIGNSGAMPSLHASDSFAIAFVLSMHQRRYAPLWYAIAVLVGVSRVWVGVHWPTDIIGGALWGILCGMAGWRLAETLRQKFSPRLSGG